MGANEAAALPGRDEARPARGADGAQGGSRRMLFVAIGATVVVLACLAALGVSVASKDPVTPNSEGAGTAPTAPPTAPPPTTSPTPRPTPPPGVPTSSPTNAPTAKPYSVVEPTILDVLPHDETCFTQGFLIDPEDGMIYESCGLYGKSRVQVVDPVSGEILAKSETFAQNIFAEGLELVDGRLLMLTWRERQLFEINRETLAVEEVYSFSTFKNEGWGIAYNGSVIVVTDGSHFLHFWDPVTLQELNRVAVFDPHKNAVVTRLNEIEFINDHEILANVWYSDEIMRVDTRTGLVNTVYDLTGVLAKHGEPTPSSDVLNGIAFNDATGEVYVTGKQWKSLFVFNASAT